MLSSATARCGIKRTYIGSIERAEVDLRLETLSKLARAWTSTPSDCTSMRENNAEVRSNGLGVATLWSMVNYDFTLACYVIYHCEEEQCMATKKSAASKTNATKPVKESLSKSGLVDYIANASSVATRDVRSVLAALETAIAGSVHKNGAGTFVLPGLMKVSAMKVPAKPKRKGINPFTKQEQWFAAKPATTKIKIRPLKRLKDAAA